MVGSTLVAYVDLPPPPLPSLKKQLQSGVSPLISRLSRAVATCSTIGVADRARSVTEDTLSYLGIPESLSEFEERVTSPGLPPQTLPVSTLAVLMVVDVC